MVLFDKVTYDKLLSKAPKFKLITPSVLLDKLRTMDLRTNDEIEENPKPEGSEPKLNGIGSVREKDKLGESNGSEITKDMLFRANKIDLKSLDVHLEKHLSQAWSRNVEPNRPKEVWEIDLAKLEIKCLIARGTYGTVYRGTYNNQDVVVKLLDWGDDDMAITAELKKLLLSKHLIFEQSLTMLQ